MARKKNQETEQTRPTLEERLAILEAESKQAAAIIGEIRAQQLEVSKDCDDTEDSISVPLAKVINKSPHKQLEKGTDLASGYDIRANLRRPLKIKSGEVTLVPTGVFMELPTDYELQVRPRSGLSVQGLTIVNSPGTVDEDYRGEVKVIVTNLTDTPIDVNDGDKVAQVVFVKKDPISIEFVDSLSETARGEGGFGHTGK